MKKLAILLSIFIFLNSCKNESKLSTMEITEIFNIKDPEKYNKQLDIYLKTTDTIDKLLTNRFWEAYQYGTATPIQWLEKKLSIIENEVKNGKEYSIPNGKVYINIKSVDDLKKWISNKYPTLVD